MINGEAGDRRAGGGAWAQWIGALALAVALLTATAAAAPAPGARSAAAKPRSGRYADAGGSAHFRVRGGRIKNFSLSTTSCGSYAVASVTVKKGSFHFEIGPAAQPLTVRGSFVTKTKAKFTWDVGYSSTFGVQPTCLEKGGPTIATRRGP